MVTLKDLAKKLDVSTSTVSKALNDSSEISQLTTDRVKALAKFYKYQPNTVARNLKNRNTKTIGVIIPSILNRFFAKALQGIEDEATKKGYQIITCISNESLTKEKKSIDLLANGSVDGFLIAASEETQINAEFDHFVNLKNNNIPLVLFDRIVENINCDKVIIDDFEAAYFATNKLIERGCKNIAFLSTIEELNVGKLRKLGFKKAHRASSLSNGNTLVFKIDSANNVQRQVRSILQNHKQIDGILAADNMSGTIAISVARNLNLEIPEDLAVVGFSDKTISQLSSPKLSFIDQNAAEIGKKAFNLLLSRLMIKNEQVNYLVEKVPVTFENFESL